MNNEVSISRVSGALKTQNGNNSAIADARESVRLSFEDGGSESSDFMNVLILGGMLEKLIEISEVLGVFMSDTNANLTEINESLYLLVADNNALMNDLINERGVGGGSLRDEEGEREDEAFGDKLLETIEGVGEGLDPETDNSGGFSFKKLITGLIGAVSGALSFALPKMFALIVAPIKGFGKVFSKIFGKGGLILGVFGKIFSKIAILGRFIGPLSLIIAGVVGISAALKKLAGGGDISEAIASGIGAIVEMFTFGILSRENVEDFLVGPIRSTIKFIQNVFNAISEFMTGTVLPYIQNTIVPGVLHVFNVIKSFITDTIVPYIQNTIVPGILHAFNVIKSFITDTIVPFITDVIVPYWMAIYNKLIVPFFTGVWGILKKMFNTINLVVQIIWAFVKPVLLGLVGFFKNQFMPFFNNMLVPFFMNVVIPIISTIMKIVFGIVSWIQSKISEAVGLLITSGIVDHFVNTIIMFINNAIFAFNVVAILLEAMYNVILTVGGTMIRKLASAVSDFVPAISAITGIEEKTLDDMVSGASRTGGKLLGARTDGKAFQIDKISYKSDIANSALADQIRNPSDEINNSNQSNQTTNQQSTIGTVNNVTNTNVSTSGSGGGGSSGQVSTRSNDSSFQRFNQSQLSSPFA